MYVINNNNNNFNNNDDNFKDNNNNNNYNNDNDKFGAIPNAEVELHWSLRGRNINISTSEKNILMA